MPATTDLAALLIDPATRQVTKITLTLNPAVRPALAKSIGRQPKFAWAGLLPGQVLAYSDERGGAPTYFEFNGSPRIHRKAVVLDFVGGTFCDASMTVAEAEIQISWGGEQPAKHAKRPGRPPKAKDSGADPAKKAAATGGRR